MTALKDEDTLKLHTDKRGHVWYCDGVTSPRNSEQTADTFLRSAVVNRLSAQVRLLGLPQNAELIIELFLRRQKREIAHVQVASSRAAGAPDEILDPVTALLKMRALQASSSCGGWHSVAMSDYAIYAMLAHFLRNDFVLDDTAATYLHAHPVYKIVSFIPSINEAALARLLVTIIDPRWYVDTRMPDRASKLELFLGLTPKIQRRVSNAKVILSKAREFRCATVLQCWKTQTVDSAVVDAPREFLWRIWGTAGGDAAGDLRASQAFVRFLRLNWLETLDTRRGKKDGLFLPTRYFKNATERQAFADFIKKA